MWGHTQLECPFDADEVAQEEGKGVLAARFQEWCAPVVNWSPSSVDAAVLNRWTRAEVHTEATTVGLVKTTWQHRRFVVVGSGSFSSVPCRFYGLLQQGMRRVKCDHVSLKCDWLGVPPFGRS